MEQTRLEKQWLENQLNQTIVQSANQANQSKDELSPDIDRVRELENELDTLEQRWLYTYRGRWTPLTSRI